MSDETVKVRLWVSTNKVGSQCEKVVEIDREDWEGMGDKEKDDIMLEELMNMNLFDWGWDTS